MTDEEFERHALSVLGRELGLADLARFIRLNRSGHGDYTAERHRWQTNITLDEIERELAAKPKG
jgi:hypothetical protein